MVAVLAFLLCAPASTYKSVSCWRSCLPALSGPGHDVPPGRQAVNADAILSRYKGNADFRTRAAIVNEVRDQLAAADARRAIDVLRAFAELKDEDLTDDIASAVEDIARRLDDLDDAVRVLLMLITDEHDWWSVTCLQRMLYPYGLYDVPAAPDDPLGGFVPPEDERWTAYVAQLRAWWQKVRGKYRSKEASGENCLRIMYYRFPANRAEWPAVFEKRHAADERFRYWATWCIGTLEIAEAYPALVAHLRKEQDATIIHNGLCWLRSLDPTAHRRLIYEYLTSSSPVQCLHGGIAAVRYYKEKAGLLTVVTVMASADAELYLSAAENLHWLSTWDLEQGSVLDSRPQLLRNRAAIVDGARRWLAEVWPRLVFDPAEERFLVRPAGAGRPDEELRREQTVLAVVAESPAGNEPPYRWSHKYLPIPVLGVVLALLLGAWHYRGHRHSGRARQSRSP